MFTYGTRPIALSIATLVTTAAFSLGAIPSSAPEAAATPTGCADLAAALVLVQLAPVPQLMLMELGFNSYSVLEDAVRACKN